MSNSEFSYPGQPYEYDKPARPKRTDQKETVGDAAKIEQLHDALQRSHKELMQYAWYDQGLTGLRERNEAALKLGVDG